MANLFVAFTSMEANLIASGMGYQARTAKEPEEFNSIRCARIFDVLTMLDPAQCFTNWNMSVQRWLKYYVLLRLIDRTKPRSHLQVWPILATFLVSAIWHGIYFGYFAFFSGSALADITWKVVSKVAVAQKIRAMIPDAVFVPF